MAGGISREAGSAQFVGAPVEEIPKLRWALETHGLALSMDRAILPKVNEAVEVEDAFVHRLMAERRLVVRQLHFLLRRLHNLHGQEPAALGVVAQLAGHAHGCGHARGLAAPLLDPLGGGLPRARLGGR